VSLVGFNFCVFPRSSGRGSPGFPHMSLSPQAPREPWSTGRAVPRGCRSVCEVPAGPLSRRRPAATRGWRRFERGRRRSRGVSVRVPQLKWVFHRLPRSNGADSQVGAPLVCRRRRGQRGQHSSAWRCRTAQVCSQVSFFAGHGAAPALRSRSRGPTHALNTGYIGSSATAVERLPNTLQSTHLGVCARGDTGRCESQF
jgi:hypothetical protein